MSVERSQVFIVEPVETVQPVVTEQKKRVARHLADSAFMEGFLPMPTPESAHERTRTYLKDRVIDQDPAIDAVIEALDAAKVRIRSNKQPIATLAFLGPTGVGKSQLAKALAEYYVEDDFDESHLIKIDCSDYPEGHEISTLTGSPPSYVGREQKAKFAPENVENPDTVTIVLFDEIEKGSPELYNLMLQIMEDGKLQLKNGEETSFEDTIIVLSSNLGAREMGDLTKEHSTGFSISSAPVDTPVLEQTAKKAFTDFFTPEFRNRIDSMVVFHPLSEEGLNKVLDLKLEEANDDFEQHYGARISLSDGTRRHFINQSLEEKHLGARPLVRALKKGVLSTFGKYVGTDNVNDGTHIRVYHRDEIPEHHRDDNRELYFYSKKDTSIRRTVFNPEYQPRLFTAAEQQQMIAEEEKEKGNKPSKDIVGPIVPYAP